MKDIKQQIQIHTHRFVQNKSFDENNSTTYMCKKKKKQSKKKLQRFISYNLNTLIEDSNNV